MRSRRTLTVVTLLVLTGILVVGAVVGVRALFAPLPGREEGESESPTAAAEECRAEIRAGKRVRSKDVVVSVYNASSQGGLAGTTREQLTERGFLPGEVGNAPDGLEVQFVRVLAPSRRDPAARLVALQFGKDTFVQVTDEEYGPGVDVVLGPDFSGLVEAPRRIKAEVDGSGC
jgi:hypothetical protein